MNSVENQKNELESRRVDSAQLERVSLTINKAMPHFRSAMGGEADHAELALGQLIVERNVLRHALQALLEAAIHCDPLFESRWASTSVQTRSALALDKKEAK